MDNLDETQSIHLSLKLHPYLQSNNQSDALVHWRLRAGPAAGGGEEGGRGLGPQRDVELGCVPSAGVWDAWGIDVGCNGMHIAVQMLSNSWEGCNKWECLGCLSEGAVARCGTFLMFLEMVPGEEAHRKPLRRGFPNACGGSPGGSFCLAGGCLLPSFEKILHGRHVLTRPGGATANLPPPASPHQKYQL